MALAGVTGEGGDNGKGSERSLVREEQGEVECRWMDGWMEEDKEKAKEQKHKEEREGRQGGRITIDIVGGVEQDWRKEEKVNTTGAKIIQKHVNEVIYLCRERV